MESIVVTKPYKDDVTARQCWDDLEAGGDAFLIDVRTLAEWTYVGFPLLPGAARDPLFVEWQSYPSMSVNPAFVERVRQGAGLNLRIIDPSEEARLSVEGCVNLIDPAAQAALVIDVGGGSTEMSWLRKSGERYDTVAWMSAPLGVVTLAERHPEPPNSGEAWYEAMVADMGAAIAAGGVRNAEDVAAIDMPVACGTAFLLADEAGTSQRNRELLRTDTPAVVSRAFSGRWASGVETDFTRENPDLPPTYPYLRPMTRDNDYCLVGADRGALMAAPAAEIEWMLTP